MTPKSAVILKCRATTQLTIRFIAAKTIRIVIVCHRAQHFPMTHMYRRMTSILSAHCGNRSITRNSIWKSKCEATATRTLSPSILCLLIFSSSFSRLVVSFKDEEFNAFVRVEKSTWIDILSNIGGFCGLLVGASLLSVIELLYYSTLRIFFTHRQHPESDDADDDRKRVIYVSPATHRNLSNRSHTLDQAQPFTFVQRVR